MITPYPPNEYPWDRGGIVAQVLGLTPAALAEVQEAALSIGVEALGDAQLRRLGRCVFADVEVLPEALSDLAAWCVGHLDAGLHGLGLVLGAISQALGHRGWAVVAAAASVGEGADRLPPFDDLVAAVASELDRDLASAIEPIVAACPPTIAGISDSPPGHELVRGALRTLASAIAELELPIAPTPSGAVERAWVAALAGEPRAPLASRSSVVEREELATAIVELARTWTLTDFEAWRTGDPFTEARAIARAHGLGVWLEAFESVREDVSTSLEDELQAAWATARATAYAALQAPSPDPLVVAIATLARNAAVVAARLLAERLAAGRAPDAAWFVELLGDPRAHPELWRDAAPAILAAMERR